MESFGLLRTNVGLTTNIKLIVDSDHNMFLDSIESHNDLSLSRYKKVKFNKKNYYDELIPYFFEGTPLDVAYHIKYDNDVDLMSSDFSKQYDEIYQYGARNILNNKSYKEEFEYFAPLYINKGKIPTNFIIFRVDGPGISLSSKENFNEEVVKKLKTVKLFDLTKTSNLGEWIETNFKNNNYFPIAPLEIDFRELEFCKWNGIDFESGGYITKSFFIDEFLEKEKEIYEFEKFIFKSYENNKIIFPNILNLSFLFDDEPSTPNSKRKWSINRYYGFYINEFEKVTTISSYITPFLREDVVVLEGNILYSPTNSDPFVLGFEDNRPFYVEYKGEYFKVEKVKTTLKNQLASISKPPKPNTNTLTNLTPMSLSSNPFTNLNQTQNVAGLFEIDESNDTTVQSTVDKYVNIDVYSYKIVSTIDLKDKQDELNKNYGRIDSNNFLINYENTYLESFDDFDNYSLWLIEIDGIYHNLYKEDGILKLSTDYSFTFNENDYSYRVAGIEKVVSTIVDFSNPPKSFGIYRLSLSDIKDFDTRIVDTEPSKYEYEKSDELTDTDETKMYVENLSTNSSPKDYDDYIYKGEVINIPVASEYTANYETFKIVNGNLSDIWRKNSVYCRWGFLGSISANDYPYVLNNSIIFEDFNRTTNPFDPDPKRIERNLDYFYTINSATNSYSHHSLHIEGYDSNKDIDSTFNFELGKYLNVSTYSVGSSSATYSLDYFSDFFYQRQYFQSGEITKNIKKYSEFSMGDSDSPNVSLFRGLKFLIYNVDSVESKNGEITGINLSSSNKYDGYKMSILLSDNDVSVSDDGKLVNSENSLDWTIIKNWEMNKLYKTGSLVISNDILYVATQDSVTTDPQTSLAYKIVKSDAHNVGTFDYFSHTQSIFWNPNKQYLIGDFVYNSNEYWICSNTSSQATDFWNPKKSKNSGYGIGETVLYKNKYYISSIDTNQYAPDSAKPIFITGIGLKNPWVATQSILEKWKPIEIWNPTTKYTIGSTTVHKQIVWSLILDSEIGTEPGSSPNWQRKYSLEPDTFYVYKPNDNPIIEMNDNYYFCNSNNNNSTLDNGIIVYVNKKWKNILININISDNTLPNIRNSERDIIYTELYKKLTAVNFTRCINDIDTKYEFTDYVTYVIINEDGTITKHNFGKNISTLPCILRIEDPDELNMMNRSIKYKPIENPKNLKPKNVLKNGEIKKLDQLNWYNNIPLSAKIEQNKIGPKPYPNLHGIVNIMKNKIWRHSGYYSPIFYDIDLFDKSLNGISNNTKFDTSLTNFGMIKERKIQKVNKNGSILKLKDDKENKSIYPMLDEFGYTVRDFFIFSSTWDLRYHYESYKLNFVQPVSIDINTLESNETKNYGSQTEQKNSNSSLL